jgi:hypothetical protein
MLNDKGPMLFINSVNTQVDETSSQKVFDSRVKKTLEKSKPADDKVISNNTTDVRDNKLEFLETRKLNNIIEMYNKNRPVLCNIIVGQFNQTREVVGIPYQKDNNKLFVRISEERDEEIRIDEINEIIIIKF